MAPESETVAVRKVIPSTEFNLNRVRSRAPHGSASSTTTSGFEERNQGACHVVAHWNSRIKIATVMPANSVLKWTKRSEVLFESELDPTYSTNPRMLQPSAVGPAIQSAIRIHCGPA
jgi:hypothetical protein